MATQKRYFDYMSPITSKGNAEHIAMAVGIGPLLGFDKATIDTAIGSLVITSSNDDSNLPNKTKDLYMANENMAIQIPSHVVITPDGILATIQGALNLTFNPSMVGTYKEFLVLANHNYVASESGNPVTFTCYPNNTPNSMLSKILEKTANIKTWYDIANTLGNIEKNRSVIVGLFSVDSSNIVTAYNPYKNTWPQPYPLTRLEYSNILDGIDNAKKLASLAEDKAEEARSFGITVLTNQTEPLLSDIGSALGSAEWLNSSTGIVTKANLKKVKFSDGRDCHGKIVGVSQGPDLVDIKVLVDIPYKYDTRPEGMETLKEGLSFVTSFNASFLERIKALSPYSNWDIANYNVRTMWKPMTQGVFNGIVDGYRYLNQDLTSGYQDSLIIYNKVNAPLIMSLQTKLNSYLLKEGLLVSFEDIIYVRYILSLTLVKP